MFKIEQKKFSDLNIEDKLFDSLKEDYVLFGSWFAQKKDETLYVVTDEEQLAAVLYLKEEENEFDTQITPSLSPGKRLKVGTFKVEREGIGIGKYLMEFALNVAHKMEVNEIYLTVHSRTVNHEKFIRFIERRGFFLHGYKGSERVYIKKLDN